MKLLGAAALSRVLAAVALAAGLAVGAQGAGYLDALVLLSEAASTPKEISDALSKLSAVRSNFQNLSKYHLAVANLYFKKGDVKAAESSILEAIEVDPASTASYMALGQLRDRTNDLEGAEQAFSKAASLSPQVSTARLLLADVYLRRSKTEEARQILEAMTTDDPAAMPAWRRLGEIAIASRDYETAMKSAEKLLQRLPEDLGAQLLRARAQLGMGRIPEALANLESAAATHSADGPANFELGKAYLAAGELSKGRAALSRASELVPQAPGPYLVLAESYIGSGELSLAIAALDRVEGDPSVEREASRLRGTAFLQGNDPGRALDAWQRFTELAPEDPRGPYSTALVLETMGNLVEAEQWLEQSLAVDQSFVPALSELVKIAYRKNQKPLAIARVERQLALVPNSSPVHRLLGELRQEQGDAAGAEASYRRALELDESNLEACLGLTGLLLEQGRAEESRTILEGALSRWPNDVRVLMLVASSSQQKGDLAAARSYYERVLGLEPENATAANNLAWVLLGLGERDKGLEIATRAHELAPDNPDIADTLGWAYYHQGNYRAALTLLNRAVAARPDQAEVRYHMGMTLYRLGESKDAARELERSVSLAPGAEFADEARRALAAIRPQPSER